MLEKELFIYSSNTQNCLFYNIHTHRRPQSPTEKVIRNAYIPKQIENLPYNISVGLHPWFIQDNWQEEIEKIAKFSLHPNVKAIGETGLDRIIKTDITIQKEVFAAHIALAEKIQKPLLFHAVRSYADFPFFLKKLSIAGIFHGFEGNLQQTKSLINYPAYFSFGKNILRPSLKIQEVLAYLPLDRVFLETDTAAIRIETIYEKMAAIKGIYLEELQEKVEVNYRRLFEIL